MAEGTRSKEQIQAEIAAARARLASNVEGLITQAHPKAVAARTVQDAKAFAAGEFQAAKAQFVAVDGTPRTTRLAALAVAVLGGVAFLMVARSIARG
ncbi:DUF3618 domain-containing protein [Propioniciclava sp. MC1595]|uniref:DUF3618 domain-containing protein n=1 Tax=Propioniciclava sp. MC1595 TaxID=2760308 RepID=UPI0016622170|nr:DUF3618 domain-containing protein [Propioniciclava sp. MC1595]MBB1494145.1 DUF3618 domain-containing protein [Propioniciclava sp. MC1595]NLE17571.1 DUF3618 domain-containing protein [Propioniciclava sp.]QTE25128.1 DUF3618 domain-containing protein [Propioniciclava sp. MC1595]